MGNPAASSGHVRFGVFEADLSAGELRKHGLKIKLQDQPFQILALLLQRPGELLTREELREKLWPGDTFVDFDHGLNNAMNRLREALGDAADTPRYIETLPRRGYRFIAQVDNAAPSGISAPAIPASPTEPALAPTGEKAAQHAALIGSRRLLARFWLPSSALALGLAALLLVNPGRLRQRLLGGTAPARIRSIAVLPLENLTGDSSQEYFVDGMTDALTTELAQIGALRVISRTSAMQYKGTKRTLPQIAKELNVDAVVEGTVARYGNRVRLNAQLVYAPVERHLWAKPYERDAGDIFTLQSELARDVVREIAVKLTPQEAGRLARPRPVNAEAYDSYLKGLYYWHLQSPPSFREALRFLQQAIEKDPNYAPAYVGLSGCYRRLAFAGPAPPAENIALAERAARKALELDDTLAEAHTTLASNMFRFHYDWLGSEKESKRALELDPNSPEVHKEYGVFLRCFGHYEEAIAESRRAWELDPLSADGRVGFGLAYLIARRYDQAIHQFQEALAMDPQRTEAHFQLGQAYQFSGDLHRAIQELEKAVAASQRNNHFHVAALGNAYASAGRRADAEKLLTELVRRSAREYVTPYNMAVIAVGLGRNREALDWLERAYGDRSFPLVTINSWPWFDPLRSDPRFQSLVRRIGLDPDKAIPPH